MEIYLVGGAVRDQLLHLPVQEWDWVVVGSTSAEMIAQKYIPVGKDFPVFLHPVTKEEYALARTERKTGHGYKGFEFHAAIDVSLEEDLCRRDLTINAMAQDSAGNIIDPCGGRIDLAEGVLRHVSEAFVEDPVRVLRLARFAARFAHLGFTVAQETKSLVREIVANGELSHLVAERVWQEMQRALTERHPRVFFDTLAECDALRAIFPQIAAIYTEDSMQSLQNSVHLSHDPHVRFASLLQFLSADTVRANCEHLHAPNDYLDLAVLAAKYREQYQNCQAATSEELLSLLYGVDAWRRPERFASLLTAWQANSLLAHSDELTEFLLRAHEAVASIDVAAIVQTGLGGKALRDAIMRARLKAIEAERENALTG